MRHSHLGGYFIVGDLLSNISEASLYILEQIDRETRNIEPMFEYVRWICMKYMHKVPSDSYVRKRMKKLCDLCRQKSEFDDRAQADYIIQETIGLISELRLLMRDLTDVNLLRRKIWWVGQHFNRPVLNVNLDAENVEKYKETIEKITKKTWSETL